MIWGSWTQLGARGFLHNQWIPVASEEIQPSPWPDTFAITVYFCFSEKWVQIMPVPNIGTNTRHPQIEWPRLGQLKLKECIDDHITKEKNQKNNLLKGTNLPLCKYRLNREAAWFYDHKSCIENIYANHPCKQAQKSPSSTMTSTSTKITTSRNSFAVKLFS